MSLYLPKILVVGLGNSPFPLTRHSVGHLIIDSLADRLGIALSAERTGFLGHGDVEVGTTRVSLHLYKSKFLMNNSGPSIAAVCRKTVPSPKSMIVISDSLTHKVETMHVRLGGSANGHNGIKSLASALGNDTNFHRFRVGIGRDETDAAIYVMSKLPSRERQYWANEGLDLVLSEIETVVKTLNPSRNRKVVKTLNRNRKG